MSWTRAQTADMLGVPVSALRAWERTTKFKPAGASSFQEFTPATYDPSDVAILQVLQQASDIGLTGTHLAQVHDTVAALRPHFQPGWSGLCVTTTDYRSWLIGAGTPGPASVEAILDTLAPLARIQVLARVEVPQ